MLIKIIFELLDYCYDKINKMHIVFIFKSPPVHSNSCIVPWIYT